MTAMRIAVTGSRGQVASALIERAATSGVDIVALARPALDLLSRDRVLEALAGAGADAIVNAAAYTAVDKAEAEPDLAMRINGEGAGHVAEAAARLGVPLIHLSTDYVFDGRLERPYREEDATGPTGAYGRSKLEGERLVAARWSNSAILRTAWVYSPFGANFVRTMVRLAETREEIAVVADQRGNPTSALDIADAVVTIARRLAADSSQALRGVFHMTGSGEASWADFAESVFTEAAKRGRRPTRVRRIGAADYPTPAKRPANSRLDNAKLALTHGVALPEWRASLSIVCSRLIV